MIKFKKWLTIGMVSALIYGCMTPIPIIVATGSVISVGKDRRTTGTIVDDQTIEFVEVGFEFLHQYLNQ